MLKDTSYVQSKDLTFDVFIQLFNSQPMASVVHYKKFKSILVENIGPSLQKRNAYGNTV